jgi:hypothetical protein
LRYAATIKKISFGGILKTPINVKKKTKKPIFFFFRWMRKIGNKEPLYQDFAINTPFTTSFSISFSSLKTSFPNNIMRTLTSHMILCRIWTSEKGELQCLKSFLVRRIYVVNCSPDRKKAYKQNISALFYSTHASQHQQSYPNK